MVPSIATLKFDELVELWQEMVIAGVGIGLGVAVGAGDAVGAGVCTGMLVGIGVGV